MWAGNVRGPLAPPGTYQVRLTALGETKNASFEIARDPRLTGVSDADLQEQFKLALQIRDRLSQANGAVQRIRALKDQITARRDEAGDARVTGAAETLTTKLTDVEGEIYQFRNQSNQDPLNFPIKLNNKVAALMGVVESGDGRPTEQAYVVFRELSAKLDAELTRLGDLVKTELPAFNRLLTGRKLRPVVDQSPTP
jgi:hypothetical protein